MKAIRTYTRLVAENGFETVRVALELTVRELNVLLVWERSQEATEYFNGDDEILVFDETQEKLVYMNVQVRIGMVLRMRGVDSLIAMGYTWEEECKLTLPALFGDSWEELTLSYIR